MGIRRRSGHITDQLEDVFVLKVRKYYLYVVGNWWGLPLQLSELVPHENQQQKFHRGSGGVGQRTRTNTVLGLAAFVRGAMEQPPIV